MFHIYRSILISSIFASSTVMLRKNGPILVQFGLRCCGITCRNRNTCDRKWGKLDEEVSKTPGKPGYSSFLVMHKVGNVSIFVQFLMK